MMITADQLSLYFVVALIALPVAVHYWNRWHALDTDWEHGVGTMRRKSNGKWLYRAMTPAEEDDERESQIY